MQCQSLGLEILGAVCAKSNKKKKKKKRNVFKSASTDFSGHWGKKTMTLSYELIWSTC